MAGRIYNNARELMTEILRDVWEMGHEIHTETMQNKVIKDDPDYLTKEIINYSYTLMSLKDMESMFSDPNAIKYCEWEIKDRTEPTWENPGIAYKQREKVWEQFLNKHNMFDYTYNERIRKQLEIIIHELTVRPDTRQAILNIWDPTIDIHNLGGIKRVPCSLQYQFLVRGGKLHVIYTMRSCDVMTHFGVDVVLAFRMMEFIAKYTGQQPGYLHHNIGSLHCYQKDWAALKNRLNELR
jgi:thymidylate synthase